MAIRKGEKPPPLLNVDLRLDFISQDSMQDGDDRTALIPRNYIEDETLRVQIYRRLAACLSEKDLRGLRTELTDRFGPIPKPVHRLTQVTHLRFLAAAKGITGVETRDDRLMLSRGDTFIKDGNLFPRLQKESATDRLKEIIAYLRKV